MTHVIAVTGAGGQLGRRVAGHLVDAGVAPRLLGRTPGRLPELPGAACAPPAAYDDAAAMRSALDGVDTLLLVSAHESAHRVREHRTAVDAALDAGVQRIVYVSFLNAAPNATFTFARDHWHTEQHIRARGVRYTFLRDSFYLAAFAPMTGTDGILRGPADDGRVSAVAHEDVAAAAAEVLLGDGHDGLTYDITGPHAFTLTEATAALSRATGRTITYQPETRAQAYASRAEYDAADWEVQGWVTSYEAIAVGELSTVSDAVPRLTGHSARSLEQHLADHPDTYRHLVT